MTTMTDKIEFYSKMSKNKLNKLIKSWQLVLANMPDHFLAKREINIINRVLQEKKNQL